MLMIFIDRTDTILFKLLILKDFYKLARLMLYLLHNKNKNKAATQ